MSQVGVSTGLTLKYIVGCELLHKLSFNSQPWWSYISRQLRMCSQFPISSFFYSEPDAILVLHVCLKISLSSFLAFFFLLENFITSFVNNKCLVSLGMPLLVVLFWSEFQLCFQSMLHRFKIQYQSLCDVSIILYELIPYSLPSR